jgi:hypothetical protein
MHGEYDSDEEGTYESNEGKAAAIYFKNEEQIHQQARSLDLISA